jgi:hypothetical protein
MFSKVGAVAPQGVVKLLSWEGGILMATQKVLKKRLN